MLAVGICSQLQASPIVDLPPGAISLSAAALSIKQGADAHSQSYELDYGLRNDISLSAEYTRVSDNLGFTSITSLTAQKFFKLPNLQRLSMAGCGGVTRLAVSEMFSGKASKYGPIVGALADYKLNPKFTLYGSAEVSFLTREMWTLETGVRYEVRPQQYFTLGYRSYTVGNSTIGGGLLGATYTILR